MMCFDNGMMLDGLLCEAGLEWDDYDKACGMHSSTCPNPTKTTIGLPDEATTALSQERSKRVAESHSDNQGHQSDND